MKRISSYRALDSFEEMNKELHRIWNKIDELDKKLQSVGTGDINVEKPETSNISFTQTKSEGETKLYLEAMFPDGWARLNIPFDWIRKVK